MRGRESKRPALDWAGPFQFDRSWRILYNTLVETQPFVVRYGDG